MFQWYENITPSKSATTVPGVRVRFWWNFKRQLILLTPGRFSKNFSLIPCIHAVLRWVEQFWHLNRQTQYLGYETDFCNETFGGCWYDIVVGRVKLWIEYVNELRRFNDLKFRYPKSGIVHGSCSISTSLPIFGENRKANVDVVPRHIVLQFEVNRCHSYGVTSISGFADSARQLQYPGYEVDFDRATFTERCYDIKVCRVKLWVESVTKKKWFTLFSFSVLKVSTFGTFRAVSRLRLRISAKKKLFRVARFRQVQWKFETDRIRQNELTQ